MYLECGAQEVAIRFKFKFSNVAQRDRCDLLRMPKSTVGESPPEVACGAAFINRGSSCGLEPEVLSPNSLS